MVVIRYQRRGKKHQTTFRVVADTKRSKLDGAFLEDLGWYNPHSKEVGLKAERVKYWLGVGAKPSNTVYNLLVSQGVIDGKKIPVHKKSKKTAEEIEAEAKAKAEKEAKAAAAAAPAEEVKADETPKEDVPSEASAKEEAPAEPDSAPAEEAEEKSE